MRIPTFFLGLLCLLFIPATLANKIAIVIDDIGYQASDQRLLNIKAPLTYAVLPHTPYGYEYALQAALNNRDVIIHLPMQADHNNHLLGSGALTNQMTSPLLSVLITIWGVY